MFRFHLFASLKANAPASGSVVGLSAWLGWEEGTAAGLIALGVGLMGVALARWVFVNREVRRIGARQSWRDTLPLTLVAMLICAVVILDQDLSLSSAAFLGLGVGWAAVLILDVLGERVLNSLRAVLGAGPHNPDLPPAADLSGEDGRVTSGDVDLPADMAERLTELDRRDGERKP